MTACRSFPLPYCITGLSQWRLVPDLTGYGTPLLNLGIYSINTVRFLFDSDPITVYTSMRSSGVQ
ncbi:Gfo/Idh/MocA family protein [Halegenticoccus tardaugens]|uniref:Gfo/Idh/MocA family protein n=1 Tax=Halegenticoccus tardaugens TaxID=2071624 RepID=UPI00374357A8